MARATTRSVGRFGYAALAARAIAAQPYEGVERTFERLAERLDRRRPPWPYQPTKPCEERVHDLLGVAWPCVEHEGFERVWEAVTTDLAARGLQVGRGAFGGWDDGDVRLGRLACVPGAPPAPRAVVETGVARGLPPASCSRRSTPGGRR